MGIYIYLIKGKVNVMSEVHLLMIVYNLKRMISIVGIDDLKRRLRGFFAQTLGGIRINPDKFEISVWH